MTNPFVGNDLKAPQNPFVGNDLRESVDRERSLLGVVTNKALSAQPDVEAEALRIAQRTGLPASTVARNIDRVRQMEGTFDAERYQRENRRGITQRALSLNAETDEELAEEGVRIGAPIDDPMPGSIEVILDPPQTARYWNVDGPIPD